MSNTLTIDKVHENLDLQFSQLSKDIWNNKYRWENEHTWEDTCKRVINGVYEFDEGYMAATDALNAMILGLWLPAGRILAGAGTGKRVTLMNCYATGTIEDSMEGIMREHANFAFTMQQGGGDGAEFSTIRPENAILRRTGTKASGPMPFMHMWNGMCNTIRSAGDRRGAMMGTFSDTHPDLPKFIVSKREADALTNFNISVLISDAFMEAVTEDADWVLYFHVPQYNHPSVLSTLKDAIENSNDTYDINLQEYDFIDDNGIMQYAYSVWKARDLWKMITENTYEYSEPGVIFIDRINEANNLQYCEHIRTTNPCGEQPLPPHGACDLGHVNLARMVTKPFTEDATFDWELLTHVVKIGVRFLDNVIDVTNYPLPEQEREQKTKRRIGLGFTGLADALAQLGLRYGSLKSAEFAERIQQQITLTTYTESIELAKERGSFPLFDKDKYLNPESNSFVNTMIPQQLRNMIAEYGIRNGVLNTVAPTGTTSIVYGNPSGGIEPFFELQYIRKVRQADNSFKEYIDYVYAVRVFKAIYGNDAVLPPYMVTIKDLKVEDHVLIQARMQRWVDASISKTINIPEDMPYDDFIRVYDLAYTSGCKGCTTYRPSSVRGSILSGTVEDKQSSSITVQDKFSGIPRERPNMLNGNTYKIKWPNRDAALYLVINNDEAGYPFECFITSKDGSYSEWTTALSLMISAIFRQGGDVSFIPKELKQIQSLRDGAWIGGKYVGSLPAYIGELIEMHINNGAIAVETLPTQHIPSTISQAFKSGVSCARCGSLNVFKAEGCKKCIDCGHSECN